MSESFFRFENTKIQIDGKDLMVTSANLSMETSLQSERVYGDYDAEIDGATTEFVTHSPNAGIRGTLEVQFLISAENFAQEGTPNNIDRFLEIKAGMSEKSINDNVVGPYEFDNIYLNNFGFQLVPFDLVKASARYSIYGSIYKDAAQRLAGASSNFAHAFKSFNDIKINSASSYGIFGNDFFAKKLQYQINVERKAQTNIANSESSLFSKSADGVVPKRLSVSRIESEMNIESNEIVPELNDRGDQQSSSIYSEKMQSTVTAYLFSMGGDRLASFSCSGRVSSQGFNVSEGQNGAAKISIKGVVK